MIVAHATHTAGQNGLRYALGGPLLCKAAASAGKPWPARGRPLARSAPGASEQQGSGCSSAMDGRLLAGMKALVRDPVSRWLPWLAWVPDTEREVREHQLPAGAITRDLEDHAPRSGRRRQIQLHAALEPGSVSAVCLAALQGADIHTIALELAARVNRDTPTCCRRVRHVFGECKLVEVDGRPRRTPARRGHAYPSLSLGRSPNARSNSSSVTGSRPARSRIAAALVSGRSTIRPSS